MDEVQLVYGQKVGIGHTTSEGLPGEFTPVLSETDLDEGKSVRAEHNGTPILLVRRGSQIYALAETCSHLSGPVSEGMLDGYVIQFPFEMVTWLTVPPCILNRAWKLEFRTVRLKCGKQLPIPTAYLSQAGKKPKAQTGGDGKQIFTPAHRSAAIMPLSVVGAFVDTSGPNEASAQLVFRRQAGSVASRST